MDTLTAANGGSPAADGGKWRRQIPVGGGKSEQAAGGDTGIGTGTTYSVAAAAQLLDVPERTLREWIRLGKIEALPPRPGERGSRISAVTVAELRETRGNYSMNNSAAADGSSSWQVAASGSSSADGGSGWQRQAAAEPDSSPLNASRGWNDAGLSPGAAGEAALTNSLVHQHRAELAEERAQQLQQQVTTLTQDVSFLRSQLDRRAEEMERQAIAEQELRKLLLVSQHALQCALERPALPPAPELDTQPGTPTKARWWAPWRRG